MQDSANGQRAARDGSVADATRPIPGVDGLSDALVAGAIESELWEARAVDANDIDVDVVQGVVTLTGTVDDILARERAVRIASLTRGVASVIDRFTVAESGRSDATDLMWNDNVAPGEVHRVGSMCRTTPVLPNGVAVAFAST